MAVQGDASALGKFLLSGLAQRQLYRGNNAQAFLIWKALHLNMVENWDRGPAPLPALGAERAGAAVLQGRSLVVLGVTVPWINSHV